MRATSVKAKRACQRSSRWSACKFAVHERNAPTRREPEDGRAPRCSRASPPAKRTHPSRISRQHPTSRTGGRKALGMPKIWSGTSFLCESVSSTVSMATMRSDGCSRLGRNTWFTEWQRRRQMAHSAPVVRRVPSSRSQSSGANHVGFVATCKSFETQLVRRAYALPVQYSCMPEVDDEIAAESP